MFKNEIQHSIGIMILLFALTLGYLSIFSFICASLRDLVISGASSNISLQEQET